LLLLYYIHPMKPYILKTLIDQKSAGPVADFLASQSGISKTRIKDAMNKGSLWIKRKKGGLIRLRSATAEMKPGDHIEFYYDEELLSIRPPEAACISDQRAYSVWCKPAGLMAQGTKYGDHCSLMRQAEIFFGNQRRIFLVHRLDREASGLMVLAHDKKAAAHLSELFQKNLIVKKYRVEVLGNLMARGRKGIIDLQLDDNYAFTEYEVESFDQARNVSTVDVTIKTGRLHQIRRHFDMVGYPVMGDPRYGKGNKNREGMKLVAYSLAFKCPVSGRDVEFSMDACLN
jgi:tRNA pseudouridine32 synthase / 23S rRNA pseudouridine746 synthase